MSPELETHWDNLVATAQKDNAADFRAAWDKLPLELRMRINTHISSLYHVTVQKRNESYAHLFSGNPTDARRLYLQNEHGKPYMRGLFENWEIKSRTANQTPFER